MQLVLGVAEESLSWQSHFRSWAGGHRFVSCQRIPPIARNLNIRLTGPSAFEQRFDLCSATPFQWA